MLVENREPFIPHLYLAPPQGVTPSEFREMFDADKTGMMGYRTVKKTMTICSAVFIQYQRVTDGRTDGQTDGQTELLYQYRASVF